MLINHLTPGKSAAAGVSNNLTKDSIQFNGSP